MDKLEDGFYWANVNGNREVIQVYKGEILVTGYDIFFTERDASVKHINPKRIIEE